MAKPITVIKVSNVTKRFTIHKNKSLKERLISFKSKQKLTERFTALENVNISIQLGETIGLVGHNGSGKSTLLKVIAGILEATEGAVESRGKMAALLELGAGFHPDLTGRENVYLNAAILGMSKEETDKVFDQIVSFSGIPEFIDTQVKFYSSGMYVRLAFAVAIHSDPDILLVDEVLAVGDELFQNKCMTKIREFQQQGRTIVLVSHSAEQVADVCNRVVVLDSGKVIFDGEAGEGIRALRNVYESQRQNEALELGTQEKVLKITGFSVTSPTGKKLPSLIKAGTDLTFTISVTLFKTCEYISGFTISSPNGSDIYRLNTEGMKAALPSQPGSYKLSFTLRNTNFGNTRLSISCGATDLMGNILDQLSPAGFLDISEDNYGAGFVQFAPEFEVKK